MTWNPTPEPRRLCGDCIKWTGPDDWNPDTPGYCHHPENERPNGWPGERNAGETCPWHEWSNNFYLRHHARYQEQNKK